jgi:hypothetical protein
MDLREFWEQEKIPIREFCKKLDISLGTIYRIFEGKKVRREVADKVFMVTEGKISLPIEKNRITKKQSIILQQHIRL